MNKRNIVVIGASAGGLQALKTLFRALPSDLPAAVFVVLHLSPRGPSHLQHILQSETSLPVETAKDDEAIRLGHAYVAPPDYHLLVESGHMHLSAGPRENRARPAVNPLFRSAAGAYGSQVIGVILSGVLDDGTSGLWEIKRRGGVAVTQLPEDAEHEDMPKTAINSVHVDYQVPVGEMGPLLVSLVRSGAESPSKEVGVVMPESTRLTCPDCHGPIQRFHFGDITEYKCRVGHAYSPANMLTAHEEYEERALWSAIESLEEGADLIAETSGNDENGNHVLRGNVEAKRKLARIIRTAMEEEKSQTR